MGFELSDSSLLIGDIGGTNARFALANHDQPGYIEAMTIPCADFDSAHDAIAHYLDAKNANAPEVISLAGAGPMVDDTIRFTNNHWSLSATDLAASFTGAKVRVLNDFNAIALAIPHLADAEKLQVGLPVAGPLATDDATIGVVGPGTGLGAVGLRFLDG